VRISSVVGAELDVGSGQLRTDLVVDQCLKNAKMKGISERADTST
jgi:hypothetical protein